MTEVQIFLQVLLSMGLGALVGVERERFGKKRDKYAFGGIRTFIFFSLLGTICGIFAKEGQDFLGIAITLILGTWIAISYKESITISKGKTFGLTGEVAALLVFLNGYLVTMHLLLSVAIATLIVTALYLRQRLHKILNEVSEEEMYSTLVFGIISLVILPFLPNQGYGPLEVLNPFQIWSMVVLICGIGYVGYFISKIIGKDNSIGLTSMIGGIVSSTATTIRLSEEAREEPEKTDTLVFGTIIANTVMFARVGILVGILNKPLLLAILPSLIVMIITGLITATLFWTRKKHTEESKITYKSPFRLMPALKFGAIFAIILFVLKIAQNYFGATGIYLASFLSGFADVDAISLPMASIAGVEVTLGIAATAIIIAMMSNSIMKSVYCFIFGTKEYGRKVALGMTLIVLLGIIAVFLT